jgi:CRISPR/Cas system-associated endonuclease Cas1
MNLYITKPGQLSRKDNTLIFNFFANDQENQKCQEIETPLEEDNASFLKHTLPIETITAIYLFSEVRINTKLLNFLSQKKSLYIFLTITDIIREHIIRMLFS